MFELIPSLLVESRKEFEEKLRLVEPHCRTVHVDILDGSLFPNTTWFDAEAVGAMRTKVNYELHLMVENPLPIITRWVELVANTKRAIVHAEMHRPLGAVLDHIKQILHLENGIALNPESPLQEIHSIIKEIDQLTLLGVHPGLSGQKPVFAVETIFQKIREALGHRPDLMIEIDGGVTNETVEKLKQAGAKRVCMASYLFQNHDPARRILEIQKQLSTLN